MFFSRYTDLKEGIEDLDAIIVIKRLDRYVIELAALARHLRKPLFLDMCDDLANPNDPTLDLPYFALNVLMAVAPALSAIVVPGAEMAVRIEGYLADNGFSGQLCHVIPDIAETRELFAATERFVRGDNAGHLSVGRRKNRLVDVSKSEASPRRIVWFGNFGGSHSNFGMFSLRPIFKHLREFHRTCPLELVIISNNITIYEALVAGCNFPTRYVSWSPSAVYDELDRADAALLTTGDDEFCAVKSSNRILQAFAASVPVIAEKSPALAEFEEIMFTGRFQRSLEECLGPKRHEIVPTRLAQASLVLQRYAPERLARQWSNLLNQAIGRSLVQQTAKSHKGILLLLDVGDDPEQAMAAALKMNRTIGRRGLLVSIDLLKKDKDFRTVLHRAKAMPMFFSGQLKGVEGQLSSWSAVIIGNPQSTNGRLVSKIARQAGMEVLTHAGVADEEIEGFGSPLDDRTKVASKAPPGPYPERTDPDGSVEWAFVIHDKGRGWILDAICQEIGSRQPNSWAVVDQSRPPPRSRNLFFSHFSLLDLFENKYPEALPASNVFVWYTHPRDETPNTIARNLHLFDKTSRVIFTCESNRRLWIERGLDPEKTVVVLGAADPVLFERHERGGGAVGLSSSFYERKNPDLMLDVVKALPHRNFVLLGRNWNRYARFEELLALPNFTYLTRSYRDYPRIYSTFDVFLSISSLEGGPIPLIEAMMCNAVPVASHTGFAPDVIEHGRNGFLFDIEAGPERVSELIEQAFALDTDIRKTVEQYSWDRFSAEIVGLAT